MQRLLGAPKEGRNAGGSTTFLSALRTQRRFGGYDIPHPKVYKNFFNKRVSRDGKRVYFTVFPHDFNEPWPFPPVYDDKGRDLNRDYVWGPNASAPPTSITGKPKRALGHYPWLGRPTVPHDENFLWVADDQVGPMPFYQWGWFGNTHWLQYYFCIFAGLWLFQYLIEHVWENKLTHAQKREELHYQEIMCPPAKIFGPYAATKFGNPEAPIHRDASILNRWRLEHGMFNTRFEKVWIQAGQENKFDHVDMNAFSFERDAWIHPSLRKRNKPSLGYENVVDTTPEHDPLDVGPTPVYYGPGSKGWAENPSPPKLGAFPLKKYHSKGEAPRYRY